MRDILFRGKRTDNGKWIEGYYIHLHKTTYCLTTDNDADPSNDIHQIVFEQMTDWGLPNKHLLADVDPSTVGQYTGMTDKNGKKIFEGDIITIPNTKKMGLPGIVKWSKYDARFEISRNGYNPLTLWELESSRIYEVLGNVYDTPELLK